MPRVKSKKKPNTEAVLLEGLTGVMLFVITGIMPLVVRAAVRPTPPELQAIVNLTEWPDAFAYHKSWLVLIPAAVIVFLFIREMLSGGYKNFNIQAYLKNPLVFLPLIYLFFVILSAVFSPYPYTAVHGTIERFEGVFAQIAYIIIFITAVFYVRGPMQQGFILAGLCFSSLLMGAIAITQIVGHDFFITPLGSTLVTGAPGKTSPKFPMAYGSLFNPNTLGLYASMLSPMLLLYGFTRKGKRVFNVLLIVAGLLMLVAMVGSRSLGGVMGTAAAVGVLLITYTANRIYLKKCPPVPVLILTAGALAALALACLLITPVNHYFRTQYQKLQTSFQESASPPNDYVFNGDTLSIIRDGKMLASLTIAADGTLTVADGTGTAVEPYPSEEPPAEDGGDLYYYDIPGYKTAPVEVMSGYLVFEGIYMTLMDGLLTPYLQNGEMLDLSKPVEAIGFEGREHWGTNRGYIWSRTFPLIRKHFFIGSGPDTFINEFPQYDIVGKKRFYDNPYIVVDKAHNLYLQTGVTTGVVSMLALLALMSYYMVVSFISLVRSKPDALFGLRLGILAAVGAFAISSMATDSTIASTSVFYVIMGLGCALIPPRGEESPQK